MKSSPIKTENIFSAALRKKYCHIFEYLEHIGVFLNEVHLFEIFSLSGLCSSYRGDNVYISKSATIEDGVYIGNNCQIHDYALVRKGSIILDDCVIGHCSEVSCSLVFDSTNITHKVSIANSIIGSKVNLGANVVAANISMFNFDMRKPNKSIKVRMLDGSTLDTDMKKVGAIVGCGSRIGMNVSLSPGAILGLNSCVYPNINVEGIQFERNVYIKCNASITTKRHGVNFDER